MTAMKPLVLVVEDEAALGTLLRYNLERDGFRVAEARDGEEALIVAAERKPDLVLLDWMLPLLSGIEVCRRLRGAQSFAAETPVARPLSPAPTLQSLVACTPRKRPSSG